MIVLLPPPPLDRPTRPHLKRRVAFRRTTGTDIASPTGMHEPVVGPDDIYNELIMMQKLGGENFALINLACQRVCVDCFGPILKIGLNLIRICKPPVVFVLRWYTYTNRISKQFGFFNFAHESHPRS